MCAPSGVDRAAMREGGERSWTVLEQGAVCSAVTQKLQRARGIDPLERTIVASLLDRRPGGGRPHVDKLGDLRVPLAIDADDRRGVPGLQRMPADPDQGGGGRGAPATGEQAIGQWPVDGRRSGRHGAPAGRRSDPGASARWAPRAGGVHSAVLVGWGGGRAAISGGPWRASAEVLDRSPRDRRCHLHTPPDQNLSGRVQQRPVAGCTHGT